MQSKEKEEKKMQANMTLGAVMRFASLRRRESARRKAKDEATGNDMIGTTFGMARYKGGAATTHQDGV